ncbi:MAG TPA: HPr family phosphocarrier protein [Lachnospiraceae bacterium]|mgnify:FL=1|nr:HPr family phosphocarrier protein [Lachnospiraceae bacterium]
MQKFSYVITDGEGIHARPAGQLVKLCKSFSSKVKMDCNGKQVDAAKLLAVMSVGAKQGHQVDFTIEGDKEEDEAKQLEDFMKTNL